MDIKLEKELKRLQNIINDKNRKKNDILEKVGKIEKFECKNGETFNINGFTDSFNFPRVWFAVLYKRVLNRFNQILSGGFISGHDGVASSAEAFFLLRKYCYYRVKNIASRIPWTISLISLILALWGFSEKGGLESLIGWLGLLIALGVTIVVFFIADAVAFHETLNDLVAKRLNEGEGGVEKNKCDDAT